MFKNVNRIIVFLLELIMLCSFAYFGFQKGNSTVVKYLLAVAFPIVTIVIWSKWAAPKSVHRFKMPYLALFRLCFFLLASLALYECNQTKYAILLALVSTATQVTSLVTEKNE